MDGYGNCMESIDPCQTCGARSLAAVLVGANQVSGRYPSLSRREGFYNWPGVRVNDRPAIIESLEDGVSSLTFRMDGCALSRYTSSFVKIGVFNPPSAQVCNCRETVGNSAWIPSKWSGHGGMYRNSSFMALHLRLRWTI